MITKVYIRLIKVGPRMVTLQKSLQIISLLSILIFIPGIVHGQSLSEMDRQLDSENLEKTKPVDDIQKESEFSKLECPEGTYYGLDNQGIEACIDILTNQIVILAEKIIPGFDEEMIDSTKEIIPESAKKVSVKTDSKIVIDSDKGEIIRSDEQSDYSGIGILGVIGVIAGISFLGRKKIETVLFAKWGWSRAEKEQVRKSQFGRCNMCYRPPKRWVYDHIDGNSKNNDISNCQALCPDCKYKKNLLKI